VGSYLKVFSGSSQERITSLKSPHHLSTSSVGGERIVFGQQISHRNESYSRWAASEIPNGTDLVECSVSEIIVTVTVSRSTHSNAYVSYVRGFSRPSENVPAAPSLVR